MSIAIWIVIALVSFVLPATELTSGGKRRPKITRLRQYARSIGLALPDHLAPAVATRIQRRQRGMSMGGVTGIVLATLIYIVFFNNEDGAAPALVFYFAAMGTALGGAWAIAAHKPSGLAQHPVVARVRSVELADYLTRGERFGFWVVPAVLVLGSVTGILFLGQLPEVAGTDPAVIASSVAVGALITWGVAVVALRRVLAAPARSGSELELAWDDAERALGLRQVVNLTVGVAGISLLFWLIGIGETLIREGFYRGHEEFSLLIGSGAVVAFGALIAIIAAGPLVAWLSGYRKGYEQRQLWPDGVAL